mmetsp:Transcript_36431/g.90654  ORF Transcript_36431/g.90654 Transcript_36431/m.90654 type:complete len:203 (+) Transcript_36431:5010-5618(+)
MATASMRVLLPRQRSTSAVESTDTACASTTKRARRPPWSSHGRMTCARPMVRLTYQQVRPRPVSKPRSSAYCPPAKPECHISLESDTVSERSGRSVALSSRASCSAKSSVARCGSVIHGSAPTVLLSRTIDSYGTPGGMAYECTRAASPSRARSAHSPVGEPPSSSLARAQSMKRRWRYRRSWCTKSGWNSGSAPSSAPEAA